MSLRDCLELTWNAGDSHLLGYIFSAQLLPSVKNRHEIRASILASLAGNANYRRDRRTHLSAYLRNWRSTTVANVVPKNPSFQGDAGFLLAALSPDAWHYNSVNASYVRKFFELAAARDIPVFLLIPPFSPELHASRQQRGLEALYSRFVRAVQAQFRNVVVIDARFSRYDHTVHVDPIHLDRQGASVLSVEVGDILNRLSTALLPPRDGSAYPPIKTVPSASLWKMLANPVPRSPNGRKDR